MLDGILNRGFSSKCKSLIKQMRTRIEVMRRRAEAKQRFLKEDLAKLLDNGLDINAYGRTEEFLLGENVLSCYDFVEQSCDYIVKQLSIMQKLRDCPEDCRGAVASLMFAAARFSDLPELRELRDLFQERYGNSLECFVNQKFVEKLSSRSPTVEKRIQLLQNIALEFSIRWDSTGFQQRMALAQAQPTRRGSSHGSAGNHIPPIGKGSGSKADEVDIALGERHKGFNDQHKIQNGGERIVLKKELWELHSSERRELSTDGNKPLRKQEAGYSKGQKHDVLSGNVEQKMTRHKAVQEKDDNLIKAAKSERSSHVERVDGFDNKITRHNERLGQHPKGKSGSSSHGERLDGFDNKFTRHNENHGQIPLGKSGSSSHGERRHNEHHGQILMEKSGSSSHGERLDGFDNKFTRHNEHNGQILMGRAQYPLSDTGSEAAPSRGFPSKTEDVSSSRDTASEKNTSNSTRMVQQEDGNRLTAYANFPLPPPYIRSNEKAIPPPYIKPNDSKERAPKGSKQSASEFNGHLRNTSPRDRLDTNMINKVSDLPDHEAQASKPPRTNSHGHEKELSYVDGFPLPKPRSVRRKHHKSSSNQGEEGKSEDARVVKKSSSSRRREHSRKGLKILFDDEHHQKDDEERMIDKLLLHYSKKPSKGDVETLRKKPPAHFLHATPDTGGSSKGSSNNRTIRDQDEMESDMVPFPKRSISLPHEQTVPSEATKVFARANSFQPDNQACHVHPKLPDYDDLTARFAALRGR